MLVVVLQAASFQKRPFCWQSICVPKGKDGKMKHLILAAGLAFSLLSCSDARDGDPKTTETNLPADTNVNKTDVDHINTNYGTVSKDSNKRLDPGNVLHGNETRKEVEKTPY